MYWERLDVEITVLPDGDFRVQETHVIRFVSGFFDYILLKIPANHLTSIRDVQAWEDGQPCATQYEFGQFPPCEVSADYDQDIGLGSYQDWYTVFLRTSTPRSNSRHTYEVQYRVHGGLRYYEGGDQLRWKAVRADYRRFPVLASRVTVHLPEGTVAEKATAHFTNATISGIGTNTVVFEAQQALERDEEMEVRVQFPHGVVAGSTPTWQLLQEAKPGINLASVLLGGLLAGGGILLGMLKWWRERRLQEHLPLEYATKPPSDMPPGMAAALVDRWWEEWNLKATLIDLARRGYLRIEEKVTPDGVWVDSVLHRTEKPQDDLLPYERMMLSRLTGKKGERSLTDLGRADYKFYVEKLGAEVYNQLIRDGYFRISPEKTSPPVYLAGVLLILGLVGAGAAYFFVQSAAKEPIIGVICPFLGLPLALGAIWSIVRGPVQTRHGAEEAARWKAFKRYLQETVGGDAGHFEAYLPYALAFGIYLPAWVGRFPGLTEIPVPEWVTISLCDRRGRPLHIPEEGESPENLGNVETFARHLWIVLETASDAFRRPAGSARRR